MPQFDLRRLETPIVQAGLGRVARHELAVAVSDAGGLGTIAVGVGPVGAEIKAARMLIDGPIAVNFLLPFLRPGDVESAAGADVIVTFWGTPRRLTASTWMHQVGSVEEARAAEAAGADAVIAQGVEAGGHVRGKVPLFDLLEHVRRAVRIPVLAAGGIVDASGVAAVLEAGAAAAVVGTRFLLSDECRALAEYKQRCLTARDTVLTELFGLGWPDAPHRVIPNASTERWLRRGARGPALIRMANRLAGPAARRTPASVQERVTRRQRPSWPLLGAGTPAEGEPPALVDSGPLYAGANVGLISDVRPAGTLVRELTP